MSMKLVSVDVSGTGARIVLDGPDREQLMGPEARNFVIKTAAANGLSRPGISNAADCYPVDENGVTDDDVLMGRRPNVGFRAEYAVSGGI